MEEVKARRWQDWQIHGRGEVGGVVRRRLDAREEMEAMVRSLMFRAVDKSKIPKLWSTHLNFTSAVLACPLRLRDRDRVAMLGYFPTNIAMPQGRR